MVRAALRLVFVLILAAPLGACGDFVRSKAPLFSAADEVGAVPLRRGVWIGREPDCAFDEARPVDDWPACAAGFVIGRKGLKDPGLKLKIDRVAAGDPMIVQIADEDGDGYSYAAVEAGVLDRRGRATAIRVWPVLCGPKAKAAADVGDLWPTEPPTAAHPAPETPPRTLFPGLQPDGKDCLATAAQAVRDAAPASKTIGDPAELRWLRRGTR